MKIVFMLAFIGLICVGAVPSSLAAEKASPILWDFEQDRVDNPPVGFSFSRTGEGRPGRWVVALDKGASSGAHVLAQTDADPTDYRFPVAVANAPILKDLRLSAGMNL